ncbi:sentrin-specific protease 1-like [Olea europaea subsp. europaea]|uniref:Sentrin-specific protease 1-like n=1 Tax=Olea europaea subsp. europaea TaxID=158383 RepID=A0A8S0PMP2_OLEEU|nr:sentrin-specific protease 1-like [Olea europaea subsp. europaea]
MRQATIPNYSGCIERWTQQEDPTLQATRNVAFQAWIYETFPSLDGIVVTRISRVHPRIVNWMADEQPSATKLEGPDCFSNPKIVICDLKPLESEMAMPHMNGVQYNKPIQRTSSSKSRRRTKCKTERSAEDASTSEKYIPSVLPLMNSNIGQAHSSNDDDDFFSLPSRRHESSTHGKSPVVEGPTAAHHSQEEPQSHGAQWDGVEDVVSNVDKTGKGKMYPSDDLLLSLEPPSFDLGIEFTSPNVLHSEETQKRVDSIVSDVVTATRTVENEDYKDKVDEIDKSAFMGWFQRGYKPKNKKKFSEEDVAIKPAFLIGSFPVGRKTWFHELINSESSLSGAVANFGKIVKYKTTTTNSWFQIKIKDIFPAFMKDPNVLMSKSSLLEVVTGHYLYFSSPWDDVDYVFMPIILTNKAHWILGLLQFRSHTLTVFNSAGKFYRDWKVLQGIEPYVKVFLALMNTLGILKKDSDYHEPEAKELKVIIDDTLPQQTNGCSIPNKFDASKFRMDITTLLYKCQQVYTKRVNQPMTEEALALE